MKKIAILLIIGLLFTSAAYAASVPVAEYSDGGQEAFLAATYGKGAFFLTGYSYGQYPAFASLADGNFSTKMIPTSNASLGTAITHTKDGKLAIAGITADKAGNEDIFFMLLDTSGKVLDFRTYGGDGTDEPRAIINAPDGGFYIVGLSNSTSGGIICNLGGYDGLLIKLSDSGSLQWWKCYGGNKDDELNDIWYADGTLWMVGSTFSYGKGLSDVMLIKAQTDGTTIWKKFFGGTDFERGYSIAYKARNIFVAASSASEDIAKNSITGTYDGWIIKLDKNGNIIWQKAIGGENDDELYQIRPTFLGLIATGYTTSSRKYKTPTGKHPLVILLDENGKTRFEKVYLTDKYSEAWAIAPSGDDRYLLTGWEDNGNGGTSGFAMLLEEDGSPIPYDKTPPEAITLRVFRKSYLTPDGIAKMDVTPFIDPRYSRTLVPIRFVAEALGYKVGWNGEERSVTITGTHTIKLLMGRPQNPVKISVKTPSGDTITLKLYEGLKTAYVDGKSVQLDAPPVITNSRTFVPIRFVAENLGCDVLWIPPDGVRIIKR